MSTETLINREAAAKKITTPPFPKKSKHDLDEEFRKSQEALGNERAMIEWRNELNQFNKGKQITDVLWNPRDKFMQQINAWNYKIITSEEARHTPFERAA